MLFRDFVPHYLETIGPRSVDEFERIINRDLIPELKGRAIDTINYEDCYRIHKKKKKIPIMANRIITILSGIISHAERLQFRPGGQNPCPLVRRYPENKRRRYMTPDEAVRISAALKRYEKVHLRAVAFLYLMIYTGARPSELTRAEWTDLDGEVLRLKTHKTDKTGEIRRVFLAPPAMAILNELPHDDKYILRRMTTKSVQYIWRKLCKEAGVVNLHLYDLRHTFASAALSAGYSLAQIGELLGHKSPTTTMRYAHMVDEDAREAAGNTAAALVTMMGRAGVG